MHYKLCEKFQAQRLHVPWFYSNYIYKRATLQRQAKVDICHIWVCRQKVRVLDIQFFLTLQPHGLQPTRLLCLWNFPGKNTGVGNHSLLQGIFLTQGLTQVSCIAEGILYCLNHLNTKEQPVGMLGVMVCSESVLCWANFEFIEINGTMHYKE